MDSLAKITNGPASMSSLIIWNVTKALEKNSYIDLKDGIKAAQDQMERCAKDGFSPSTKYPEEDHLMCALLAWQQLGHSRADSLYEFIQSQKIKDQSTANQNDADIISQTNTLRALSDSVHFSNYDTMSKEADNLNFGLFANGPVVKIPIDTKIVMRVDAQDLKKTGGSSSEPCCPSQEPKTTTTSKLDACCNEFGCIEPLAAMDETITELRSRAAKLAQREKQRVEILERAETAWRDLELGYQRRLTLAEEKEEDIMRQIDKAIKERNRHKEYCVAISKQLKSKGDEAEKCRVTLSELEKEVCGQACARMKLSEEAARGGALLAEHQCRLVQLDRDLEYREEQARRKVMAMDSETECARTLTLEVERALRAELSGLREQIGLVSKQLLDEDAINLRITQELAELRHEKSQIIEDLETCKSSCDATMQHKMAELQEKREIMEKLKANALECKCKFPVDATVQVKRTPSLAALCKCDPEDRLLKDCSCTSVRQQLISNLLSDLFGGLQAELGGTGSQMPCQLLKCLEDRHNWDKATNVKTNLQNFFFKLLIGELDIAIATSIENYHAKWVGASCADKKMTPGPLDDEASEGWEQRALERRAQELATKLAEQLFEERAELLTTKAKQIVTAGPPPCDCRKVNTEAYSCITGPMTPFKSRWKPPLQSSPADTTSTDASWKVTRKDVAQLKLQIHDLRKASVKKEDLKEMKQNIAQIVKQTAVPESEIISAKDYLDIQPKSNKKELRYVRNINIDEVPTKLTSNKVAMAKKKYANINSCSRRTQPNEKTIKQSRKYTYNQDYAVNLCLCEPHKVLKDKPCRQTNDNAEQLLPHRLSTEDIMCPAAVNRSRPINTHIDKPIANSANMNKQQPVKVCRCDGNCKCFNKKPSNTSLDNLLKTLMQWKYDLGNGKDPYENLNSSNINSPIITNDKYLYKNIANLKKSNQSRYKVEFSLADCTPKNETINEPVRKQQLLNLNQAINNISSEYVAHVNLDKSNELSKKVGPAESYNRQKDRMMMKNSSSRPCKCLYSSPNDYIISKRIFDKAVQNVESETVDNVVVDQMQKNTSIDLNYLAKSKGTKTFSSDYNRNGSEMKIMVNQSDISTKNENDSELCPDNLDYYIKFLGVTLVNTDFNKPSCASAKKSQNKVNYQSNLFSHKECCEDFPVDSIRSIPPKIISKDNDLPTNEAKCECNAKLEELQNLMYNIMNEELIKRNVHHKARPLNSQNLDLIEDTTKQCDCCYDASSKDLEVNAFDLLEDHLKQKFKALKVRTSKFSWLPPEEEEKIFSTILKRVKQVISDCANEQKRNYEPTEGSWNRAYGLLQEYLKIKIKRAQRLPVQDESNDVVLPDILEKVGNLIENDFKRLEGVLYKSEKKIKALQNSSPINNIVPLGSDLPEKDTNALNKKYSEISRVDEVKHVIVLKDMSAQIISNVVMETKSCNVTNELDIDVETASKQNSTLDTSVLKQTMSSQVPPDFGIETKSCGVIIETQNKNEQTMVFKSTSSAFRQFINNRRNPYSNVENTNKYLSRLINSKGVSVNFCRDRFKKSNDVISIKNMNQHQNQTDQNLNSMSYVKSSPNLRECEIEVDMRNESSNGLSHIELIKKSVGRIKLNACSRTKSYSSIQNNDQIYLKPSIHIEHSDNDRVQTKGNTEVKDHAKEKNIAVPCTKENLETINDTFEDNIHLEIGVGSEGPLNWFECPEDLKSATSKTNCCPYFFTIALTNDNAEFTKSDTSIATSKSSHQASSRKCTCESVPLCHVKMLVENIEKSILESKCTCDSVSMICPVHRGTKA